MVKQPAVGSINGYVQKGPFIIGSTVTAIDLTQTLGQTGRNFTAQITNNNGAFSFNDIALTSGYCLYKADGFFYNEVRGVL